MKNFVVQPGEYISPDSGLSDDFVIETLDDTGNPIQFRVEPREWLAEWEIVSRASLPSGASYSNLLLISAAPFDVHFLSGKDGNRRYEFSVFDYLTRSKRKVTLSENEVNSLADQIREGLAL
jgi:hypothetical protein